MICGLLFSPHPLAALPALVSLATTLPRTPLFITGIAQTSGIAIGYRQGAIWYWYLSYVVTALLELRELRSDDADEGRGVNLTPRLPLPAAHPSGTRWATAQLQSPTARTTA